MTRIKDGQKLDQILFENKHRFECPGWMFAVDSNLDKPEDWSDKKLKVLIMFLSMGPTRAVSSTDIVLVSLLKQKLGSDIFVDTCYLPTKHNADILDELSLPWAFGNVSHRVMEEYDLVMVSNSTVDEKYNLFAIFDRSDFPMYSTMRLDNPELPFIMFGGAGSSEGETIYGPSLDGKHKCLIDMTYVGYGERYLQDVVGVMWDRKQKASFKEDKNGTIKALYQFPNMYNPRAYEHIYKADGWAIESIKKVDPDAPDFVKYAQATEEDLNTKAGFEVKTLYNDGNFDSNDIQISAGCSGRGVCAFCHEGSAQAWRQKDFEKVKKETRTARGKSIASTINYFSFNSNFHSQYEDLMFNAASNYPNVSAIAMRADELAARPDYFKMDKYLGIQRITLGVEGVSDRIRNGYLNKRLTEEEIMGAAGAAFKNRFMQVKWFFILSGYERQEDWDEGIAMLKKVLALRDSLGANTHMKVSFSLLCYYPHTAIAWDARLGSIHVMEDHRISYFIEKMKEIGIGVRFSSRGKSVVFQQMQLDAGRILTPVLEKMYRDTDWVYYRNVPDDVVDNMLDIMVKMGLPSWKTIFAQRDYDFIFPSQVIVIKNHETLIEESKRHFRFESEGYCLVTQAKPKSPGCKSCGLCDTPAQKKRLTTRKANDATHSIDDVVVGMAVNKPLTQYRFTFNASQKYDFLHKRPLAHYYLSQALGEDVICDRVYGVYGSSNPTKWNVNQELQYPFHGKFFFDLQFRDADPIELKPVVGSVLQCTGFTKVPLNFDVKCSDLVVTVVEVKNDPKFSDSLREWDGKTLPYMSNDIPIEWADELCEIPRPMYKKGETMKILMTVPTRSHLIKWLSKITRRPYHMVLRDVFVSMQNLAYLRVVPGMQCKLCSSDAVMDLSTGKVLSFCPECLQKALYTKVT